MEGQVEHKTVPVNGINMHFAEIGQGPLVLFIHGFPEFWYSWRHQMSFMAKQGYRAVSPDLRGYGDTTGAPKDDPSKFTTLDIVGDLVELLNKIAPQEEKVFVVGHDWGAVASWALCLYRPDKVKAFVCLSVAFNPRNPMKKPLETLRAVYGDDYYVVRFQDPGAIEGEFEKMSVKNVLKYFLTYKTPGPIYLKKGKPFEDINKLPCWLSEEEIDFYTTKYEETGFTGALNFYRAIDRNWELTSAWTGAKIQVPVKFIVGDLDLTYNAPGAKDYLHKGAFKKLVPLLDEVVVLQADKANLDEIPSRPVGIDVDFEKSYNNKRASYEGKLDRYDLYFNSLDPDSDISEEEEDTVDDDEVKNSVTDSFETATASARDTDVERPINATSIIRKPHNATTTGRRPANATSAGVRHETASTIHLSPTAVMMPATTYVVFENATQQSTTSVSSQKQRTSIALRGLRWKSGAAITQRQLQEESYRRSKPSTTTQAITIAHANKSQVTPSIQGTQ
ncbi:hypothetical protein CQW23_01986 [Capsicum baccatum]|uniref:soluble epoxide hydrolase n=1 Tax=Capsicum baccatum TaxID=33114 RepID=A0A2G2XQ46_CAPBA|nr:hypothetical protein CQW23_01986 [Capsicum baccatum]